MHEYVIQSTYPGSEPIYLHITKMKDSFMLWAGTAQTTKLNDWVVCMPMPSGMVSRVVEVDMTDWKDPATATLFSSSSSTISTSVASRLCELLVQSPHF